MITEIRSSLDGFHSSTFDAGMNIVLADADKDSDERGSANGLGKTTLIRIIRFCLGGSIARNKILGHPELKGVSFGITFVWSDLSITVDRAAGENTVLVSEAFLTGIKVKPIERKDECLLLSLADWKLVLSSRFASDAKTSSGEFLPSFRELLLYLVRLEKVAFNDPLTSFKQQPEVSKRFVTSFLLGLNWGKQRELQNLQKRQDQVDKTLKALRDAETSENDKSIGELDAERVVLEREIQQKRAEVSQFNVRDDYRTLEKNLDDVNRELHNEINENHNARKLLEHCQLSTKSVPEIPEEDPVSILEHAGAIFKEETLRSLDEIANFHKQVYKNRSEFLRSEVDRLNSEIASRDEHINDLSSQKQKLLEILESSGALETLIDLRSNLSELESRLEKLKTRIEERKRFDRLKDEINEQIISIRQLLKRDLDDRREIVDEAVGLFAEYTQKLYEVPGRLGIDVSDRTSGYSFKFTIDREGSDGVDQMVVFCFDLMIATLRARRGQPFKTLIHDSSIFADVDPRQYGAALQLAAETAQSEGFQYICCLNSGALPKGHLGDLKLDDFVRLRLSDDSDKGRLLGRKLPPREQS